MKYLFGPEFPDVPVYPPVLGYRCWQYRPGAVTMPPCDSMSNMLSADEWIEDMLLAEKET